MQRREKQDATVAETVDRVVAEFLAQGKLRPGEVDEVVGR